MPEDVVKDRFDRLLKLVQEKGREASSRFQGEVQEVLVETESKEKGIFHRKNPVQSSGTFPGNCRIFLENISRYDWIPARASTIWELRV